MNGMPPPQIMTYSYWLRSLLDLCNDPEASSDDIIDMAREIAEHPVFIAAAVFADQVEAEAGRTA